jgi:hypothetical protein
MPAIKFRGVDFIDFDTLLNDDERPQPAKTPTTPRKTR